MVLVFVFVYVLVFDIVLRVVDVEEDVAVVT
jgi:4-hydroxybenzoate polyprenyltransferase